MPAGRPRKSPLLPHQELLKQFRAEHNLTQVELAEGLKVELSVVGNWESGNARPALESWMALSEFAQGIKATDYARAFYRCAHPDWEWVVACVIQIFTTYDQGANAAEQKQLLDAMGPMLGGIFEMRSTGTYNYARKAMKQIKEVRGKMVTRQKVEFGPAYPVATPLERYLVAMMQEKPTNELPF